MSFNITLIASRHDQIGVCNSTSLFKILQILHPTVIFEEKPIESYEEFYVRKAKTNLESEAILLYLRDNPTVEHKLVDLNGISEVSFEFHVKTTHSFINSLNTQEGSTYRRLIDENRAGAYENGFDYLNSRQNLQNLKRISFLLEDVIFKSNDEKLINSLNYIKEMNNKREDFMLKSIYQYCKMNRYESGVFITGSSHVYSFLEKIPIFEQKFGKIINWRIVLK